GSAGTFTCGTWSESHELLGVADDTDTIYIVKPNGEEMTKITKKHLNASFPIVGLIVLDDASDKKILLRLSLLVLVSSAGDTKSRVNGSTGFSTVSIWRRKDNLQMEPLVSTQTEGSYSMPKDYPGQLTSPKVLFSPQGNFVAHWIWKDAYPLFNLMKENVPSQNFLMLRAATQRRQLTFQALGQGEDSDRSSEQKDLIEHVMTERPNQLDISKLEWNLVSFTKRSILEVYDNLINSQRFSVQEYVRFRDLPVSKAAMLLAESGKIGALNLLFKRHPYSLIPSMLEVLAAIPETIPVQSYGQLLPAISAPSNIVLRDEDWVECDKMVKFIKDVHQNHESNIQFMTEPIIMKHMAFQWPSVSELSSWYKKRARDIDTLSGQLDNCMCLVDLAIHKGISELKQFLEDIFYLHQLIYSDENVDEISFSMSLDTWEQLPDYEKFKLIMMGAIEDNVIPRLHKKAIPFMQSRFHTLTGVHAAVDYLTRDNTVDSFLVRWLKELASQNKLDMCLIIIEEGCRDMANHHFFKDEVELVDCALQCVYLCNDLDRWSTMSTILSKLPQMRDIEAKDIKHRLKLAEGHVEAGRLLTYYQVPKPISFFLDAHADEKGVKQILRLLLSKFIRWQPARTDHDWANMWCDLQSLQEKAFAFLDLEYMLIEFCRGLLKAGKFSLARNYLKGTSSVALATDKAENLVIQAAREYFFSAPTLACPEIWKAKECLNIFPSSRNVRVEADIIDAITVRLPSLGVNLLPMAFRQIKDPMEIIKLAITSQSGAYLNVEELIEIAKLLGLSSQEDISTVQEAIAREAAYAGDVQLAFDLCLVLAKKGHGSVWDLCAALARSQALENMHSKSQKLLLGFALSHCDEESIGELLHEWKDLDLQDHCETLIMLTGREPAEFSEQNSSNPGEFSGRIGFNSEDQEPQLPWLLKLSEDADFGKRLTSGSVSRIQHVSIRTRAVMTILSWLTRSSFTPRDDLIASLAKSIMEPPVSDGEDYPSLLHSYGIECKNPAQRRELLLSKFQEKHKTQSSVKMEKKQILNDALILAHTYGVDRSKVLLYYLNTILVSEVWSVDDIVEEVSDFKQEILAYAGEVIKSISSSVYPAIDGHDKQRLAFLYDLLCDCYMQLEELKALPFATDQNLVQKGALGLAQFCKIIGQECSRISFIKGLNFKNIAGLQDLNFGCFNNEVCTQINEKNVEALAKMVQNLALIYGDTAPEGLLSWKYVYTHFVTSSLVTLEGKIETETHFQSSEEVYSFISEIEQKYDVCEKYIRFMESPGVLDTVLRFFTIILCINKRLRTFPCDSSGKECLVKLINFWLRLMNDMEELVSLDISGERFYSEYSMTCLKVLLDLLVKGIVSPNQGWCALINYVAYGLKCGVAIETFNFCRAMIFCGCGFEAIACVFSEIVAQLPAGSLLITTIENTSFSIQDLPNLYLSILETILQELDSGSLGRQSLHRLLSSLSKLEGDLEDLKKVRSSVWERMSMFSGNLQLPSHLRVYALELMQFISDRRKNLDGFSSEGLADLLPWEGWDDLKNTIANQDMSEDSTAEDVSSRFMSTLVALKSSQLVSSISPSLEITPEDIVSVLFPVF
ncbi:UNVERIFIED_CONTAM: MAG2-interacting protein 2, partial [Sesamum angustifolium]